jgi:hypothetical protein
MLLLLPLLLLPLLLLQIHAKSTQHHRWLVMLDAAAYVPTHALNLSRTPADFVSLSFYKVFGYPAGTSMRRALRINLITRASSPCVIHSGQSDMHTDSHTSALQAAWQNCF